MPDVITLSEDERRKFAAWLKQDAESNRLIVEQLEKFPHASQVVELKKRDIMAALIVAKNLLDVEFVTLTTDESNDA